MAYQTGSELNGLAVLTLTGGQRIGRIHDIVFRHDGLIMGFLLTGDDGGRFLPIALACSVGVDALTIENDIGLIPAREAPSGEGEYPARSLHGRPVICEAGNALGKIVDIGVDTSTLEVTELLMKTGFLDALLHNPRPIPMQEIRAIGQHGVIVSNDYNPASTKTAPHLETSPRSEE